MRKPLGYYMLFNDFHFFKLGGNNNTIMLSQKIVDNVLQNITQITHKTQLLKTKIFLQVSEVY